LTQRGKIEKFEFIRGNFPNPEVAIPTRVKKFDTYPSARVFL